MLILNIHDFKKRKICQIKHHLNKSLDDIWYVKRQSMKEKVKTIQQQSHNRSNAKRMQKQKHAVYQNYYTKFNKDKQIINYCLSFDENTNNNQNNNILRKQKRLFQLNKPLVQQKKYLRETRLKFRASRSRNMQKSQSSMRNQMKSNYIQQSCSSSQKQTRNLMSIKKTKATQSQQLVYINGQFPRDQNKKVIKNIKSTDNLNRCGNMQKYNMKNKPKLVGDISEIQESNSMSRNQSQNKQQNIFPVHCKEQSIIINKNGSFQKSENSFNSYNKIFQDASTMKESLMFSILNCRQKRRFIQHNDNKDKLIRLLEDHQCNVQRLMECKGSSIHKAFESPSHKYMNKIVFPQFTMRNYYQKQQIQDAQIEQLDKQQYIDQLTEIACKERHSEVSCVRKSSILKDSFLRKQSSERKDRSSENRERSNDSKGEKRDRSNDSRFDRNLVETPKGGV